MPFFVYFIHRIADGWTFRDTIEQVRRNIGIADLDDAAPFRDLSGGPAARVMLAGVLLSRPTVLLLDEPTNHLDLDGIRWLEGYLAGFPGALLVVTHDRRFLDATVSWIYELDPVTRALQIYEAATAPTARSGSAGSQRPPGGAPRPGALPQAAGGGHRRHPRPVTADRGHRRRAWLRQDQALRQEGGEEGEGTRGPAAAPDGVDRLAGEAGAGGNAVAGAARRVPAGAAAAALENVSAGYDGASVLRDVSLVVKGRDRIAVTGANGAGKSTLFRVLAGELAPQSGSLVSEARVGVLPQTHHRLPLERTVLEHYRRAVIGHEHEARAVLGWFLFSQEQLFRPLGTLSAGERSRLLVAILVMGGAELLLLDEPTNHLDFASIDVIERALDAFRGTILTVSHDREFIRTIGCDRVVDVRDGRVVER